jgi:hypothetical protein
MPNLYQTHITFCHVPFYFLTLKLRYYAGTYMCLYALNRLYRLASNRISIGYYFKKGRGVLLHFIITEEEISYTTE